MNNPQCPDPTCRCVERSPDTWTSWKMRRFFQAIGYVGHIGTYRPLVTDAERQRLEQLKQRYITGGEDC